MRFHLTAYGSSVEGHVLSIISECIESSWVFSKALRLQMCVPRHRARTSDESYPPTRLLPHISPGCLPYISPESINQSVCLSVSDSRSFSVPLFPSPLLLSLMYGWTICRVQKTMSSVFSITLNLTFCEGFSQRTWSSLILLGWLAMGLQGFLLLGL